MDYSAIILAFLKDESIKSSLNPIVYYGLKLVYSPDFAKRSRYFGSAIRQFYETVGGSLDISLFGESVIMKKEPIIDNTMLFDMNGTTNDLNLNVNNLNAIDNNEGQNMNLSVNRDYYMNMSNLFHNDWRWCLDNFLDYDYDYILDKEDDYVLLKLIRNYIFSDEDPKSSQLMLGYNLFASSIELIFCLKLVENFPNCYFNPREAGKYKEYTDNIRTRIQVFYNAWSQNYRHKFEKNGIIKTLIGNRISHRVEDSTFLDLIQLSMIEPLLNSKYISFTKLIKEGPFCFEIEEVARQICIIDHELLASLKHSDYTQFVVRREVPESFNKFLIREKQIKCYVLLFVLMHNNLENKKNMIQHFISLAHSCKLLNNHQTSHTIISAFNIVGLGRKKLLWKLIEKKYRDIYSILEKDFNDIELNENTPMDSKNAIYPSVPHVNIIKNNINNFIIRIKTSTEDEKVKLNKEYKDFYLMMEEFAKIKYSFFKLNPLYDFFKFGFLEIFKPKKWNLKLKIDFSQYTDNLSQLDQLLEFLIVHFKRLDN